MRPKVSPFRLDLSRCLFLRAYKPASFFTLALADIFPRLTQQHKTVNIKINHPIPACFLFITP